jgi:uncharacterized protein DUF6644
MHLMSLLDICTWIENTPSSTALRESIWMFPIVEGSHVLGLGLSVGTIVWFDLRLMGAAMKRYSVSQTFSFVKPWMFTGFAVMMVTGVLLFWSHALKCYNSNFFRLKLVLLLLAGINIVVFHSTIDRRRMEWDKSPLPPFQARLAGFSSLLLWLAIVAAGRLMAYTL